MTLVRIKGRQVDVARLDCAKRSCFHLGFDKGAFTPGRGYTSYYKKERPVCAQRHYHGCPSNSVCPICRVLSVLEPGEACERQGCAGVLISPNHKADI